MEERIIEFMLTGLYHCGYYSLFLMTFLETAALIGVFIPGESMVILAGLAASQGIFEIHEVVWVSAVGAILGDTAGYFLGLRFGERIFNRFGRYLFLKEGRIEYARRLFTSHGGKTVFFGRFMSLLRSLAPVLAGMTGMPYQKFLFYNITGGAVWAAAFALLGYFVGNSWHTVREYSTYAIVAASTLLSFGYLSYLLARRWAAFQEKAVLIKKLLPRRPEGL